MFSSSTGLARRAFVAGALLFALILAGCGGDDDGGDDSADGGPSEDVEEATQGETTEITIASEGDPVEGGSLVYGLEAETDGWNPVTARWAVSGHTVAMAVFDPLATWSEDGEAVPYLAESFTPNDDFTEWDIKLRAGVQFHNGEPLTADAVKKLLDGHLASALTAPALEPVESVEVVDELTAKVVMNTPWAVFPVVLTGQPGYIPAPEQLDSPTGTQNAIGTGPFIQQEWTPDRQWVGTKNPNYWRDGLPYLDEVTFRPIPDNQARFDSVRTGDINVMHTTDDDVILQARDEAEAGDAQIIEDGSGGEETFIMLNTLVPPLDDERVRQALAYATDKQSYIDVTGSGILLPANGPFNPASPWYNPDVEDTYPQYDPTRAQELVDEYEAEVGPIEFTLGTTPVPSNQEAIAFIAQQWAAVGIDVEQITTEQSQFIIDAVSGNFEANLWRQFGAPDPDGDYVWWVSQNANAIGEFSLNFARNKDPEIDDGMNTGRETDDTDARKAAYDEVQVRLDTDLPYIWLNHTLWALITDDQVRNVGVATTPDGEPQMAMVNGRYAVTELFLADG
jgi:ABC-type transport system substrate-binding protein